MECQVKECQTCETWTGNRDEDPRAMHAPKASCELKRGARERVGMVWADSTCEEWEEKR